MDKRAKLFPSWARILKALYVDGRASKSELGAHTITLRAMVKAGLIAPSENAPISYAITVRGIQSQRSGRMPRVIA